MIIKLILSIVLGYFFGLIQGAYIVGRINGIDIRKVGSGNLGTTNVIRGLGVKWGIATYLIDAIKSILACLIIYFIYSSQKDMVFMLQLYGLLGVILGHSFPFYLNFKGGKGIASFSGGILVSCFIAGIPSIAVFALVLYLTKYVSLSSMALSGTSAVILSIMTFFNYFTTNIIIKTNIILVSLVLFLLTVFTHRTNIIRLLNKTENRIKNKQNRR